MAAAEDVSDDVKHGAFKKRMDDAGDVTVITAENGDACKDDAVAAQSAPAAAVDVQARVATMQTAHQVLLTRVHTEYLKYATSLGPLATKDGLADLLDQVYAGKSATALQTPAATTSPATQDADPTQTAGGDSSPTPALTTAAPAVPPTQTAAPSKELTVFDALIARMVQGRCVLWFDPVQACRLSLPPELASPVVVVTRLCSCAVSPQLVAAA